MSHILTIAFLAVLSFEAVGAALCHRCKSVGIDNQCTIKEDTCNAHFWNFCFSRMVKKGGKVVNINRGCTFLCRSRKDGKHHYEEKMLCCVEDYCNNHNFWTND